MKRIWTRTVLEWNPNTEAYEVNENDSQYHYVPDDTKMALCGGDDDPQVQTTEPWGPQQPYIKRAWEEASKQFLDPSAQTLSPEAEEARKRMMDEARQNLTPSQLEQGAHGYISDVMAGKYLYGGEGFNKALDAAKSSIIPEVESRFAGQGRLHSGLAQTAETGAIGDAFAKQYEQERQLQQGAARMAPAMSAQDRATRYDALSRLAGAGQMPANYRQQLLKDYINSITGRTGSQVSVSGGGGGTFSNVAGGALSGAAAGAPFGPWGAGIGAVGGGVLGLLG